MRPKHSITLRRLSSQDGFSMIEALIAMVFFFTALTALLAMHSETVKTNNLANTYTLMCARAAQDMEWIMALPFDDPQLTNTVINLGENRTLSRVVSNPDTLIKGTRLVTVTVTWPDSRMQGGQRQYILKFLKPEII